ncbi:hypothetical protein [Agrobacterium tumefaciens]|uniref:hypothetical protein n=1 Tax=Agrobacterium tumefaciens TaxID=358 RepID=UPI002243C6FE|nr:hypothetical protein [Agrobacterium tumefaciens]MCW8060071.1 hypothetical protein [Agrobacterium tumefaciens]MCW8142786.1 hypothetical protein [Agrobacterium tumefaciens]
MSTTIAVERCCGAGSQLVTESRYRDSMSWVGRTVRGALQFIPAGSGHKKGRGGRGFMNAGLFRIECARIVAEDIALDVEFADEFPAGNLSCWPA